MKRQRHASKYGHLVVLEALADVVRDFDLGEGGLYPVDLYMPDQTER